MSWGADGPCLHPLRPVCWAWPPGFSERSPARREGLGGSGPTQGGSSGSAVVQGRRSSRRVPPSPPPPRAPTLLQLASSQPEQSALLCPLGPPRAWPSPSRSAIGQGRAPPPHIKRSPTPQGQAFVEPGCSPRGVGVHRAPEDASHPLYNVYGSQGHTDGPHRVLLLVCRPPDSLLPELGLQGCLELCACMTPRGRALPVEP